MPLNHHLSTSDNTPDTLWWTTHPTTMFHHHHQDVSFNPTDGEPQDEGSPPLSAETEWEPMFEKLLTPSDVGKLNRLVIPKQHAEKHFPLVGEATQLLSFEDESGKWWRFRYSYWSSSQSYVLTKGWSRFVKDKRLDAGDVVLFHRHRADSDRLFIGWRRRGESSPGVSAVAAETRGGGGGFCAVRRPYPGHNDGPSRPGSYTHGQAGVPGGAPAAGNNPRRVRLFGVNLECRLEESEPPGSSHGPTHHDDLSSNSSSSKPSHGLHFI